jgi:hypothetical protein
MLRRLEPIGISRLTLPFRAYFHEQKATAAAVAFVLLGVNRFVLTKLETGSIILRHVKDSGATGWPLARHDLLIVAIGYLLPKDHVAARAISIRQQPADVFALISDFKDEPSWRADVQQVEMLPERDGHTRFTEKSKNGTMPFEVEESTPPLLMVTQIDGKNLPFGGKWIFDVFLTADGCRLNITERGEVYNPVFRFVSRFVLGFTGTLDRYLTSVAKKFGESTVPVEGTDSDQ